MEKSMDVGSLVGGGGWGRAEAEIKGETKRMTNRRDAANNIGTIDRTAVPGIRSGVSSFNKNSVSATVIGSNGNGFIQKLVEMFDADGFMVPLGSAMEGDVEEKANLFEEAFKGAAIVDNDNAAETNFEEHILNKKTSKVMGGDVASGGDQDKSGEITHGVQ
jgi:hypothetical protein